VRKTDEKLARNSGAVVAGALCVCVRDRETEREREGAKAL
jgi:hypothetical protein